MTKSILLWYLIVRHKSRYALNCSPPDQKYYRVVQKVVRMIQHCIARNTSRTSDHIRDRYNWTPEWCFNIQAPKTFRPLYGYLVPLAHTQVVYKTTHVKTIALGDAKKNRVSWAKKIKKYFTKVKHEHASLGKRDMINDSVALTEKLRRNTDHSVRWKEKTSIHPYEMRPMVISTW